MVLSSDAIVFMVSKMKVCMSGHPSGSWYHKIIKAGAHAMAPIATNACNELKLDNSVLHNRLAAAMNIETKSTQLNNR